MKWQRLVRWLTLPGDSDMDMLRRAKELSLAESNELKRKVAALIATTVFLQSLAFTKTINQCLQSGTRINF
jgi:hypothetical protein